MNYIILSFVIYGIVLKLYDDIEDNKEFGKYFNTLHIEILKSLIICFLVLTGTFIPYYNIVKLGLLLIVINDLDNNFWISYLICGIIMTIFTFHQLEYNLYTIVLILSQFVIGFIDITFFGEDSSMKKLIWRSIIGIFLIIYLIMMKIVNSLHNDFFVYYIISTASYFITSILIKLFIKCKIKNKDTETIDTETKDTETKDNENKETENKDTENKDTENKDITLLMPIKKNKPRTKQKVPLLTGQK